MHLIVICHGDYIVDHGKIMELCFSYFMGNLLLSPTHFINSIIHAFSCKILYINCSVYLLSDCSYKDRQSSPVSFVEELHDSVKVSRRSQYLFLPAFSNQVRPKLNFLLISPFYPYPTTILFLKKFAFYPAA